ncbi:YdiU family protein [Clostridium nitritogenes]|uniref:Protein nucleotidyltransferase YdiU n=1 Tax=Clostridium nitritogenes TaxID=83340 RepID=A0ABN1LI14_9CLOT
MKEAKETIGIGFNFENTYVNLPEMFFTKKGPSHVKAPSLVKLNSSLAKELGLNIDALQSNEGIEILSGNKIPEGSIPLAQVYAGHQFGHFTLLGDGRALLLGEHITPKGERIDIQLKGSGRTPYSRGGDGKAALGPMLREYIISEAMHALNIPTTRSLAVTKTGEAVIRETYLKGAILTRVASSHIRVGTFQYARNWGTAKDIKKLANYTLKRHFKEIENEENPYLSLLKEVIKRQAELIAKWQLVGFIHGVMNTDNMTISGETIDYGPCAFMDTYDPETVFSSIDIYGRYSYKNQPNMAVWNLARFAETLLPLLSTDQDEAINLAEDALAEFSETFKNNWISGMRAKLGIFNEEAEDEELIKNLLSIMQKYKADYTNTFRALTIDNLNGSEIFDSEEFKEWYKMWQEILSRQDESKDLLKKLMKSSNPAVIPRNHRVEEALEAAEKGDYSVMDKLLDVLINPFEYSKDQEEYAKLPKPSSCKYKTYCGT